MKRRRSRFDVVVATTRNEYDLLVKISNKLSMETEDEQLPEPCLKETARILYENPSINKLVVAVERKTGRVAGISLFSLMFEVERSIDVWCVTVLYVLKEFRKDNIGSLIFEYFSPYITMHKTNVFYQMKKTNPSKSILSKWDVNMDPDLRLFRMDSVFRDDAESGRRLTVSENLADFESRMLGVEGRGGFVVRRMEIGDLDLLGGREGEYENIMNRKWCNLNMEGLRISMDKRHRHLGYSLVVLKDSEAVGVVTLFRDFSDWRAGFSLWLKAIYLTRGNMNEGDIRGILCGMQRFCLGRVKMTQDPGVGRSNYVYVGGILEWGIRM